MRVSFICGNLASFADHKQNQVKFTTFPFGRQVLFPGGSVRLPSAEACLFPVRQRLGSGFSASEQGYSHGRSTTEQLVPSLVHRSNAVEKPGQRAWNKAAASGKSRAGLDTSVFVKDELHLSDPEPLGIEQAHRV